MGFKISNFEEINISSELDGQDLFYIVDHKSDGTNVSKNITYSKLVEKLDSQIGIQFLKEARVDDPTKKLILTFELKNGSLKEISVDLSGIVNIYEGDGVTINIDDNTSIISVCANYLSSNALDNISSDWTYSHAKDTLSTDGYVISSQLGNLAYKNELSASEVVGYKDTTYGVQANGGISVDSDNNFALKLTDIIDGNKGIVITEDGKLSASEGRIYQKGHGIDINDNTISVSLGDLVYQNSCLSVIDNKLSVMDNTKVTYVIWS